MVKFPKNLFVERGDGMQSLSSIEAGKMKMLTCCGEKMRLGIETGKFDEFVCSMCGDTVYVKKPGAGRPQMIDD